MRILNEASDKSISNVTLYLSEAEASHLLSALEALINKPTNHHSHVNNDDFSKEITVCIYDPANLGGFDERSKTSGKIS
jgi:hypothetical protein